MSGSWMRLLWTFIVVWIFGEIEMQVSMRTDAIEYVREELELLGRCRWCGYDLRQSSGKCPESGQATAAADANGLV